VQTNFRTNLFQIGYGARMSNISEDNTATIFRTSHLRRMQP